MKRFYCLTIFLFLLFETPLCFASPDDSFNISFGPDFVTHCHQYRVDFALTATSTVGAMGAYNCKNRPDHPVNGSMVINSQVTNTFNRILVPYRYAPHGAFRDGYFVEAMAGMEWGKYQSQSGSGANVRFINTALLLGYQWVWLNGFNIAVSAGVAHLSRSNRDLAIAPNESANVADYLNRQTSPNTHMASGILIGWAF